MHPTHWLISTQVNERIRAHVAGGGVLAFCPEGTVNRKDQTKCLPLRRGSFQLAVDLRLPIYGISALGQSATRSLY